MNIPKNRNATSPFITVQQAQERYNSGRHGVMRLAEEAGALIKFDRTYKINVQKCDDYFVKNFTV